MNLNALAGWILLLSLGTSFVVIAEPAPTDVLFIGSLLCCLLSFRVKITQSCAYYCVVAFLFIIANSVSATACLDGFLCTRYMLITLYLVTFPIVMSHLAEALGPAYVSRMYTAFFAAIVISSLAGVLARVGVLPGPKELFFREDAGLRLSPFFKDPNVYGPYLGSGLVLYAGHIVAGTRRLWRGALALGLIWLPLFLAFSRAAWLAVAISSILFLGLCLLFARDRLMSTRLTTLLLAAVGIMVPLSIVVLVQFDLIHFFENRLGLQSYDTERFGAQSIAFNLALENPLGIGPGRMVGRTHLPGSEFALASHNVFLKVWVENGWLGIAAFLGMIFFVIAALTRAALRPSDRVPVQIAIIAALIGILVNSYFIDTLHWRHLFVLLGFGLVELDIYDRVMRRPDATRRNSPGKVRAA